MSDKALPLRQKAATDAYDKMVTLLIQYTPARDLKVGDVLLIAEYTRTVTFDALRDVDSAEGRS